jgi:hypothetical protein
VEIWGRPMNIGRHNAKLLEISILKEKNNEIKIKAELKLNRNNRFYIVRSMTYVHKIKPKRLYYTLISLDDVTI